MSQDFKCGVGLHKYKVHAEYDVKNPYGAVIGSIIVSRCENCGKIKQTVIYTDNNYIR